MSTGYLNMNCGDVNNVDTLYAEDMIVNNAVLADCFVASGTLDVVGTIYGGGDIEVTGDIYAEDIVLTGDITAMNILPITTLGMDSCNCSSGGGICFYSNATKKMEIGSTYTCTTGLRVNGQLLPTTHNSYCLGVASCIWTKAFISRVMFSDGTNQCTAGTLEGMSVHCGNGIAPLNVAVLSTAIPTAIENGDIWIYDDGSNRRLYARIGGVSRYVNLT
ncbi:MAG TPA: hypothetical protein ENI23_18025 [bacterium]|nr:hypothetical protein [bacterium]